MGMQVTSLSIGSSIAAVAQQDLPLNKRPPLPGEQKAGAEYAEAHSEAPLPGSIKPPAPDLQKTTLELEQIGLAFDRRLKFVIDQESGEILIKVIDNQADKVIKVLPPEELQRLHGRIRDTIGFLFDATV